jgi:hypothetical protein
MARLTDTQLVILSTASRRNDRGVDLRDDPFWQPEQCVWISTYAKRSGCQRRRIRFRLYLMRASRSTRHRPETLLATADEVIE